MTENVIDAALWARMMRAGAAELYKNKQTINDLNVFPIPDGDTGDNMYMTVRAGVIEPEENETLGELAVRMAQKNLLGARGNSGVILSRFLYGVSAALSGLEIADAEALGKAFENGVSEAYRAVSQPKEGTILTVLREASEKAFGEKTVSTFFDKFLAEGKASLKKTPDLLPVLKKAGVVDSGGAGLLLIVGGMYKALDGGEIALADDSPEKAREIDLDKFTSDSELKFGYCTELLVRLQSKKVDVGNYDVKELIAYLETVGESVVAFRTGSIVKLHVHTMTPEKVLEYCHTIGEFLTLKIENMMLEHHEVVPETPDASEYRVDAAQKEYAIVVCACGEGLKQTFLDFGVDEVVSGGQSMNPSAEAFLDAIGRANAKTVFLLPNNPNVILAAEQARDLAKGRDVRVIRTASVGDGLAALSMADLVEGDPDAAEESLRNGMAGVLTAQISKCVRNAEIDGVDLEKDDYIGFAGKEILAHGEKRLETAEKTLDGMDVSAHDILMIIRGKDCDESEARELSSYVRKKYPSSEVYDMDGGQEIYDYVLVAQ